MEVLPDTPGGKISGKSILICAESRVLKGCVMEMKALTRDVSVRVGSVNSTGSVPLFLAFGRTALLDVDQCHHSTATKDGAWPLIRNRRLSS
jgi:hypothetical protein